MDATARQERLTAARTEAKQCADALAALEAEDRAAADRITAIDAAATVTRDRLVEAENLRRRRRQLEPEREVAARALEEARATVVSAERRIGGVMLIRGLFGVGIGPSQAPLLRADGADGATMYLGRQGVRAVVRGDELILPFTSLSHLVTEDAAHDAAWCSAQAQLPIPNVLPAPVRDALLVEPFRFGFDRPEDRLSGSAARGSRSPPRASR